jgi:nicotinamidase-related amidase
MDARRSALIVVDMLNPYEHEDADRLAESVERVVGPITALVQRARERDVEVIYVNDNHGDWRSSRDKLVERVMNAGRPDLIEPLLPPEDAEFILKVRHSIFYGTSLEYLLSQLGVDHIVLSGQVTEQCILYSALDAYIRHLKVGVPTDGVAHIHENLAEAALDMMERNMNAQLAPAADIDMTGGRDG